MAGIEWSDDSRCACSYDVFRWRVVDGGWEPERALLTPEHQFKK